MTFDFISAESYGYKRFPIVFVQNQNGDLVFESRESVKCNVSDYYTDNVASGKEYPSVLCYEYEVSDNKLVYTLRYKEVLEAQGFRNGSWLLKWIAEKKGMLDLSYSRFFGEGDMCLTIDGEVVERSGELIYEFMYPGKRCKGLLETARI